MLETFSLSDELSAKNPAPRPRRGAPARASISKNIVTDIKEAVRTKRINIFVDEKFFCSLDISQVVDFKLKIGKQLDKKTLQELKNASDFSKFYALALEYVFLRPHSTKEIRDYLRRKTLSRKIRVKDRKTGEYKSVEKPGYDEKLIPVVLQRLDERGYLNDEHFAKLWVENRKQATGLSLKKLRLELRQKGLSHEVIEKALAESGRDERSELQKVIAKKQHRYPDQQKFIQYLLRQGFNYSDVLDALSDNFSL